MASPDSKTIDTHASSWRARLSSRLSDEQTNLRLFVAGAACFFAGLGALLYADQRMVPSIFQELVTAAGLLLIGIGTVCAFIGYIALSIARLTGLTGKK